MNDDDLAKLTELHASLLEAVQAINDKLEANELRRLCLRVLSGIERSAESLRKRSSDWELTVKEFLEPLDAYTNFTFKSTLDLRTVLTCLGLIADLTERAKENEGLSPGDLWQQTRPLLDDLETLESGDPPYLNASEIRKREISPRGLRDADRAAVRERFRERGKASFEEMIARREKQAEDFYP